MRLLGLLAPVFAATSLFAQSNSDSATLIEALPVEPVHGGVSLPPDDRILGVIPNYQTVSDPNAAIAPLTARQKYQLFLRETADPFTFAGAAMGAALSQRGNEHPKYGVGAGAYGQRYGAALADIASQNFFSDALLAAAFHEDPRYYRMGPGHSVSRRLLYSMSRSLVTRKDSGAATFNFSCVLGTAMGIGLSNAYYPTASRTGSEMGSRLASSFVAASFGNLLPEFWPDVKQRIHRFHH